MIAFQSDMIQLPHTHLSFSMLPSNVVGPAPDANILANPLYTLADPYLQGTSD